jgi:antitoxin component YwqK of YwqJK toxin-antitoxin module
MFDLLLLMRCFILIFFLFLNVFSYSQFEKKSQTSVTFYPGDTILKHVTVTKTKKLKKPQMYEFYYRITTEETIFYPNGVVAEKRQRVFKMGSFGKGCGEILYRQRTYYENGKLREKVVNRCDCRREKVVDYTEKGKLKSKMFKKTKRLY